MSRSIFACRFHEQLERRLCAYLTRWRMTLRPGGWTTRWRTERSPGYEAENAFKTALKRGTGSSPRRYAREKRDTGQDLSQKGDSDMNRRADPGAF